MKNSSTIDPMGICAAMFTASLLAACGGGASGSNAADTATAATVAPDNGALPGSASPGASAPTPGATAGAPAGSDTTDTTLSALQLAEALATSTNVKAISAALVDMGSQTAAAELSTEVSAPAAAVDSGNLTVASAVDASSVGTLSVSASNARFVRITDEGHVFTLPSKTTVRYGDPVSNRWIVKTLTGFGECSNRYFGNDPAFMVAKVCQAAPSSTSTIVALAAPQTMSKPTGFMPAIDLSKIPTPWIGFTDLQVATTTMIAPPAGLGGAFRTSCSVAAISFDDPIVFPGQAGKAHLHTFFGNTGVNANSTPESLRTTGASTCVGGVANRSAYWVPAIIDTRTGAPVMPDGNGVYYKAGEVPSSMVHPVPAGLRMIAGNPSGKPGDPTSGFRFACVGGPNGQNDHYGSTIPNCDAGAAVFLQIFFPQCWDGVNFDSPDHKSHMANPSNYACPASHPVAIPNISFNISYRVSKKDDPLHWRMSSDNYDTTQPGGYSAHGDWFNGWKTDISDTWGKNCVAAEKDCFSELLGDGRFLY